jgi:hypothetical protein
MKTKFKQDWSDRRSSILSILEQTSLDPPAFHEAFADVVALFQHFSVKEALTETVRRTGGDLHRGALRPRLGTANGDGEEGLIGVELTEANPLVGLARQFGDAIGTRKALREALGKPPIRRC